MNVYIHLYGIVWSCMHCVMLYHTKNDCSFTGLFVDCRRVTRLAVPRERRGRTWVETHGSSGRSRGLR